jgi:hypothetical protein
VPIQCRRSIWRDAKDWSIKADIMAARVVERHGSRCARRNGMALDPLRTAVFFETVRAGFIACFG